MPHTYASVADLDNFIVDNGGTVLNSQPANVIARKLAVLESSSRRVDAFCDRSRFGSGFGPRLGTNRYTVRGRSLWLADDLLAITATVTATDTVNGTATNIVDETDYLKHTGEDYESTPYRQLTIHEGSSSDWGVATRGNSVPGKWGYQDSRLTLTPTVNEALDTSETGIDVTATTDLSAGLTLLLDSEQVYIRSISSLTLTVDRAVNGTTAAAHNTGIAIARYQYPSEVTDTTLRIALKRWAARGAGADGGDGAFDMGAVVVRESEDTILRRGVGHLKIYGAG